MFRILLHLFGVSALCIVSSYGFNPFGSLGKNTKSSKLIRLAYRMRSRENAF